MKGVNLQQHEVMDHTAIFCSYHNFGCITLNEELVNHGLTMK